jgi:TRAP-type transport system periplasmic protein
VPLSHVMNLGFVSSNSAALAATMLELYENNELYHAEWDENGVRPLIFGLQSSTVLGCTNPVDSVDDLDSKNVRAAALITEDFASIGANVVGLQASEVLESIERGVLDCWSALPLDLATDGGVSTITPYIYDYGRGSNGALELMIGTSVWDSLTESQQEAITRANAEVADTFIAMLEERIGAACDKIEEAGGTVSEFPSAEVSKWEKVAGPANEAKFLEIAGPNGEQFLKEYKAELAKFESEYSDFKNPTTICVERFQ